MGYIRAEDVLPNELIELIQQYVDGVNIYIPRKEENRIRWGQVSGLKSDILKRDTQIYLDYTKGIAIKALAEKYYLSDKSIWRILHKMKKLY